MTDRKKRRSIVTRGPGAAVAALEAPTVAASAQAAASTSTSSKSKQGETHMKTLLMTARKLTTISVLTLLAVASAHGQTGTVLSANVPFGFEAGGTSLPAGTYQFKFHLSEQSLVISGAKAEEMKLKIIAQLAGASLFKDTGLVFDAFEGRHVLSEVWIPDEGGVLVNASPKRHTHEMVIAVVSGAAPKLSGKEVFERTCARCHGPQGKGNPAADKFFQTPVPRLDSAYVQAKSDQELRDIISHGRRKMDPVRMGQATLQHLLYPESVGAVISYVRTFKQP
jgi:cytochrome c553